MAYGYLCYLFHHSVVWWARRDSNSHGLLRWFLRPVRLPISALALMVPSPRIELGTDPYQGPVRPLNYKGLCVWCVTELNLSHTFFLHRREVRCKKLVILFYRQLLGPPVSNTIRVNIVANTRSSIMRDSPSSTGSTSGCLPHNIVLGPGPTPPG